MCYFYSVLQLFKAILVLMFLLAAVVIALIMALVYFLKGKQTATQYRATIECHPDEMEDDESNTSELEEEQDGGLFDNQRGM